MFLDIAPSEFLLTAIVAVVFIGPKDMPRAMRTAGRWMGKMRRVSGHFRAGIETMIREAEMEEMEAKWRAQNEAIMQAHPSGEVPHLSGMDAPGAGLGDAEAPMGKAAVLGAAAGLPEGLPPAAGEAASAPREA